MGQIDDLHHQTSRGKSQSDHSSLRFYDKEGLLPFVKRNKAGNRIFTDSDLEWLGLICCLKKPACPSSRSEPTFSGAWREIRSINLRRQMFDRPPPAVIEQIDELKRILEAIYYKIAHYTTLGKFSVDQKPDDSKVFATD
jgi:DNA-binding transcriptional MerR regulator